MPGHRYLHLDVFTDRPLTGNQLAVFPDARAIDPALMQGIAAEMAFSETTFVLPAETPGTDARLRIFTPGRELPMAGHPTIGTTFALAGDGAIAPGTERFTLGLGIGPTPVTLQWGARDLSFAWMRQPVTEFGPAFEDVTGLADALGVEVRDITDAGMAPEIGSSGVPVLLVPMASRRAVNAARPDLARLDSVFAVAGVAPAPVLVFTLDGGDDGASAFSRVFAPMFGIAEDPATGGASGPLGCYLVRHGAVSGADARHMLSTQGVAMGRPSRIHIDVRTGAAGIEEVLVGGQAVLVGEGTLRL